MLRTFTNRQRRRPGARNGSSGRNALLAVLGSLALFVICSLSLGFINAKAPVSWGMVEEVGTERHVPFDSRLTSSARYVFVSVTESGAAIGLQPGDVIDMTRWTTSERLAFAYPAAMHPSRVSYERGGQAIASWHSAGSVAEDIDPSRISDVLLRSLLLCSGLLIIRYGHGQAALAAGVYLASIAMADKPTMTFAGLPASVQTTAIVIATLSRLFAYVARFIFAMQLLRLLSRRIGRAAWSLFGALCLVLLVCDADHLVGLLIGTPPIAGLSVMLPVAQISMQAYSIILFAAVVVLAPSKQRRAATIIFVATLLTVAAYIIQQVFLLTGQAAPAWAYWYFNSGLLFVGICYPWAIFARRIPGVDFIISRGVAYAIAIGIIVIAVNLLATVLEQVASGWIEGVMLDYGMPVMLGLSLNWMQGRFTMILGALLDHDVRRATRALNRLRAAMVATPDAGAMSHRICRIIAHSFRATHVAVYSESGGPDGSLHALARRSAPNAGEVCPILNVPMEDPALREMRNRPAWVELDGLGSVLRDGVVFPLLAMGRLVGALHCGVRAYGEGYDPAHRAILEEFARELALALCLDPGPGLGDVPTVSKAKS